VLPSENGTRLTWRTNHSLVAKSAVTLGVLTIIYAIAIIAITRRFPQIAEFGRLGITLVWACGLTLCCLLLRYVRWRWLLARHGHRISFVAGLPAYFSGFALTATPGKVGELLRVRYFSRLGVPASQIISCFVFELSTDLVALILLSLPTAVRVPGTFYALAFAAFLLILIFLAARSRARYRLILRLRRTGWRRLSRVISKAGRGISLLGRLADARLMMLGVTLGLLAWGSQAYGLVLIASALGFSAPTLALLSIMPAAMLLGAASMVPGGLGATEAAAIFLIHQLGLDLSSAALVVIAVRVTTLWFATALGFSAIAGMALVGIVKSRPRKMLSI
jgi:uncharacterized protein (TIRG00374 family)